jgi:hypothetical protein
MLYIDVIRPSLEILTLCTANYLFLSWTNLTFFVSINTHTHSEALCSVEEKALGCTEPVTEITSRSRKLMLLWSRSRLVRRADILTAIWADCLDNGILYISHLCRPPWPVTGIALFLLFYFLTDTLYISTYVNVYIYIIMNDPKYLTIHTVYVSTLICPLKMTESVVYLLTYVSTGVKFWSVMSIVYHTT